MASQAGTDPESVLDRTVAAMNIPMGRAGTADEVADRIAFLASPAARISPAASSPWMAEPSPVFSRD